MVGIDSVRSASTLRSVVPAVKGLVFAVLYGRPPSLPPIVIFFGGGGSVAAISRNVLSLVQSEDETMKIRSGNRPTEYETDPPGTSRHGT